MYPLCLITIFKSTNFYLISVEHSKIGATTNKGHTIVMTHKEQCLVGVDGFEPPTALPEGGRSTVI